MQRELMSDLAAMAILAYEGPDAVVTGVGVLGLRDIIQFERAGTVVVVGSDERNLVVAFRGTDDTKDVLYDAEFSTEFGALGTRVHSGFRRALDAVWDELRPIILSTDKKVFLTGHSLGGALAVLTAARLLSLGRQVDGVVTLGQPRVGKAAFSRQMNFRLQSRIFRVINYVDPVPRVPLAIQGFRHPGRRWYFGRSGTLTEDASAARVLWDEWAFRIRRLRSTRALGLAWHAKGAYLKLLDWPAVEAPQPTGIDMDVNP